MSSTGSSNEEGSVKPSSDDDYWNENQCGLSFEDLDSTFDKSQLGTSTSSCRFDTVVGISQLDISSSRSKCDPFFIERDNLEEEENNLYSASRYIFGTPSNTSSSESVKSEYIPTRRKKSRDKSELLDKTGNFIETVKNIVLGLDFNLSTFKSLSDKQNLLQTAIDSHDGNAVLVVILFLKRTLKTSLFLKEVVRQPEAVNMYLTYLHEANELQELTDILMLSGKQKSCALMKYEDAIMIQDTKRKLNVLENLLNTYCQAGLVDRFMNESVLEHCMCLKDYQVLMDHKLISEQCDESIIGKIVGRDEISDSCVVDLLIFSLFHFYELPEVSKISPTTIKEHYKVYSHKFQWCALMALAATRSYQNLEKLFLTKKWLFGTKLQSRIPYRDVMKVLAQFDAPIDVLEKFCNTVDNENDKIALARLYKCHKIVIEILKKRRRKSDIIEFQKTLSENSIDYQVITNLLRSGDIKWKY